MIWQDDRLPGVTFELVDVDPDLATAWLDTRKEQRTVVNRRVERYAADMEAGQFPFTGDPVRFSDEGRLIDGQHRLEAIQKSGLPHLLLVIRGLTKATIQYFDIGAKRSLVSYLQMRGVPSSSHVSSTTTALWRWDGGEYGNRNVARVANPPRLGVEPTIAELWEHYESNPMLVESVRAAARVYTRTNKKFITVSQLALFWMLLTRIDPYQRDAFFGELCSDEEPKDMLPGYPITILRDRFKRPGEGDGEPRWYGLSLFIRTWNAWVRGERLTTLRRIVVPRWDLLPQPNGLKEIGDLDRELANTLAHAEEDDE